MPLVWVTLPGEYECEKRACRKRRNDQRGKRKRSQRKKALEADESG